MFFPSISWNTWLARNNDAFNNNYESIPTNKPYERAMEYHFQETYYTTRKKVVQLHWTPLIDGLKLNIDGSYDYRSGTEGAGCVLRDNIGTWIRDFMERN